MIDSGMIWEGNHEQSVNEGLLSDYRGLSHHSVVGGERIKEGPNYSIQDSNCLITEYKFKDVILRQSAVCQLNRLGPLRSRREDFMAMHYGRMSVSAAAIRGSPGFCEEFSTSPPEIKSVY
jgi:hypothetical protein